MTSTAEKRQMKSAARLYAVQALFQMESSGQTVQAITREFESHRFGATYDEGEFVEGDVDHFRAVVASAVNWQAKIDQLTDRALVAKWPIDRIDPVLRALFRAAGAEWREAGCSMCIAMNGDDAQPGQYVMSTSNRNFEGRQGRGVRTLLASPLSAAAAAVTGRITDVRTML